MSASPYDCDEPLRRDHDGEEAGCGCLRAARRPDLGSALELVLPAAEVVIAHVPPDLTGPRQILEIVRSYTNGGELHVAKLSELSPDPVGDSGRVGERYAATSARGRVTCATAALLHLAHAPRQVDSARAVIACAAEAFAWAAAPEFSLAPARSARTEAAMYLAREGVRAQFRSSLADHVRSHTPPAPSMEQLERALNDRSACVRGWG